MQAHGGGGGGGAGTIYTLASVCRLRVADTRNFKGRERREEEAELLLMSAFNFIQICYSFSQNGRGVLATFTASAVDTHSRRGQARPITISLAFRPTIIGKQHFLRLQIE